MRKISLNLAEDYIPDWSTWECIREVVCNAIDADPEWKMEVVDADHIQVITATSPSLHQLLIIGATTKRDGSTIGQFGEGLKLAALVATRMGGSLIATFPSGKVTFKLHKTKGFASRVLYAHVDDSVSFPETTFDLTLPGCAAVAEGKFVSQEIVRIPKKSPSPLRLFSKGVYICTLKDTTSLWDWNLNFPLNRDRKAVDNWDAAWRIGSYLADHPQSAELYQEIMEAQSYEFSSLTKPSYMSTENKEHFLEAFRRTYGEHALLPSTRDILNSVAINHGYNLVHNFNGITSFGLPTVDNTIKTTDTFEEVKVASTFYEEAAKVLDILEIPAEVKFFTSLADILGKFDGSVVWISESLTAPGNRARRLGTIAHECAHKLSGASDGDFSFEHTLTEFTGKLLHKLIS